MTIMTLITSKSIRQDDTINTDYNLHKWYTVVKSYLAKHSGTQYKQAQTRHSRQRLDKMEKTM
jgi:hypothetical protein